MGRRCCVSERRGNEIGTGRDGEGFAPGPGISEERPDNRVGREVVIALDHDGLVGLCDDLSVDCDFDHRVWFCG